MDHRSISIPWIFIARLRCYYYGNIIVIFRMLVVSMTIAAARHSDGISQTANSVISRAASTVSTRLRQAGAAASPTVGREIATPPLAGLPHLGSGITWMRQGRRVMATPHLKEPKLTVIALNDWSVVGEIAMQGPGFFLRGHENSPYVWADVFFGPNRDAMHVIDRETLKIVRTLRPVPGATVAHVEFDRYGRYALVSVWEDDGAVIVCDAQTLEEVRRLPMRKPSGKYNVFNKITFSDGTSH